MNFNPATTHLNLNYNTKFNILDTKKLYNPFAKLGYGVLAVNRGVSFKFYFLFFKLV